MSFDPAVLNSLTSAYPKMTFSDVSTENHFAVFPYIQASKVNWMQLFTADATSVLESCPLRSEAYLTMLASEDVLRRDWDLPEEDEAWANL
jgi:hypothetical protein